MATYIIGEEIHIRRQAGDNADLEVIVPNQLPITGADVTFKLRDPDGVTLFTKTTTDCTIIQQTITIPFLPSDTRGRAGKHRWELQLQKPTDYGTVTIGRGDFNIIKEEIVEEAQ